MAAESPDAGFEARVREQAAAAIEDELGTATNGDTGADRTQNGDGVPLGKLDTAREVAEEEGYTRMDFMQFQADLTGRGWSRDDAQAAWHTLRDEGVINGDGDGNGNGGDGDDGGGDDTATDSPQPTHEGPEAEEEPPDSVDELEARVRAADGVFLIVQPDCPTCGQAKEALSEWIDDGMVDVLDIQESDKAVDIAMEKELAELPALIVEDDGEFRII